MLSVGRCINQYKVDKVGLADCAETTARFLTATEQNNVMGGEGPNKIPEGE